MRSRQDKLQFRLVGKGFILSEDEGLIGRKLTKTFVDQHKRTYVQVNGEMIPLTDQHNYLAVD